MNKFVIIKCCDEFGLRFANIDFHKDLVHSCPCYGGGMFEFTEKEMILFGSSADFGEPQWESIGENKIHIDEDCKDLRILWKGEDITEKFIFDWI